MKTCIQKSFTSYIFDIVAKNPFLPRKSYINNKVQTISSIVYVLPFCIVIYVLTFLTPGTLKECL